MNEWGIVIVLLLILMFLMISNIIELHNKDHEEKLEISTLVVIVVALTMLWLLNVYYLSYQNEYSNFLSKHFSITVKPNGLQLNEWGDYFAGFFAPVIFLWIVIGVYIQKSEFRNAVKEYSKSIQILDKQSVNTDIQHQNEWFNRNSNILEKNINSLESLIQTDLSINSLNQFYKVMSKNSLEENDKYFPFIQEIIIHDQYIKTSLQDRKNDIETFSNALENLLYEYDILFNNDIKLLNIVLLKYILTIYYAKKLYNSNEEEFKNEKIVKNYQEFFNVITKEREKIIEDVISEKNIKIMTDYLDIDFVNDFVSKSNNEYQEKIISKGK